jgi:hypothetical protein
MTDEQEAVERERVRIIEQWDAVFENGSDALYAADSYEELRAAKDVLVAELQAMLENSATLKKYETPNERLLNIHRAEPVCVLRSTIQA